MHDDRTPRTLYDIHSHVLPALDDGAVDDEMALAMLRTSAQRGVTHVVATPHSAEVVAAGGRSMFEERLATVRSLVADQGLPVEVLPGMEVRLTPDVPEGLPEGVYWSLGGSRYVLTELDYTQWARYTEDVLFGIALQGYTPLLAHVERIVPLQQQPDIVDRLVSRGCYTQITAMSLLGGMGPEARRAAELFLARGLVHTVASDMHRPSGNRQPMPGGARGRLRELAGEEAAHVLLYENPAAVLANAEPRHVSPPRRRSRRWWSPW